MATSGVTTPTFNGQSKFASDFQQVLTRAVNIASLPLQQMQNDVSDLTAQQSAMSGLQSTFTALQTALQDIGTSTANMAATVSNTDALTATATSSALPGTYTIQVDSLGSYTTAISNAGSPPVTDPSSGDISSSSSFTLTIDGVNTAITPSGNSLDALATAINNAGVGAQATIVNLGSGSSPDYRLSVTSTNLAADTIQLTDSNGNPLLNTVATGSPATYQVNGLKTQISTNSPQITLAPGLTADLLQTTTSPVTITVGQDTNSLGTALSNFATAYNSAVSALAAQYGPNAGALDGNTVVLTLSQALGAIADYSGGPGGTTTLADLGLTLDDNGNLDFDPTQLSNESSSAIQQFLGSTTTGGFLESANNTLTTLTDSTSGIITSSLQELQTSITNENTQISDQTNQINTMEANLQTQLTNTDASIYVLEQQYTYMGNLFATMYPNVSSTTNNGGSTLNGG